MMIHRFRLRAADFQGSRCWMFALVLPISSSSPGVIRGESVEPPEIRRGFLTLATAQASRKRNKGLFQVIRGDLQMHTVWSDGSACIQEMAEAAANRGCSYIAVTDHAKGLKIAGGIDEVQLRRQEDEIGEVNAAMRERGFRVLRSIELNLSPGGAGDMDARALR